MAWDFVELGEGILDSIASRVNQPFHTLGDFESSYYLPIMASCSAGVGLSSGWALRKSEMKSEETSCSSDDFIAMADTFPVPPAADSDEILSNR